MEKETRKHLWIAHCCSAMGVLILIFPILPRVLQGFFGLTLFIIPFYLVSLLEMSDNQGFMFVIVVLPLVILVFLSIGLMKYIRLVRGGTKSILIYVMIGMDVIALLADIAMIFVVVTYFIPNALQGMTFERFG